MKTQKQEGTVAILGRWQPVHLGHQAAVQALCERFENVLVGIGSTNVHDYRNPFSLAEVTEMLRLSLAAYSNYTLVAIPDMRADPEWRRMAIETFANSSLLVTANPYVKSLLADRFSISRPVDFIPQTRKIPVTATMVRREMALGGDWQSLVPAEIAAFILQNRLDRRFRSEFGLHTLAMETIIV
jgi:nicotinamide-nucleotide adenylyltransferase